MANHFRQTAERLREIAEAAHISSDQQEDLRHSADILCKLEQLKRDLISSDFSSEAESDRVALELMALLGLQPGS